VRVAKAPEGRTHSMTLARGPELPTNAKRLQVRRPSTAVIWNEIVNPKDLELADGNWK